MTVLVPRERVDRVAPAKRGFDFSRILRMNDYPDPDRYPVGSDARLAEQDRKNRLFTDAARNMKSSPLCIKLPLRIESEPNTRGNWGNKARRTKALRAAMIALPTGLPIPCVVTMTRIAPRALDDDNLQGAFKAVRDGIADRLGIDDRDPRVRWVYSQERGRVKEYAARIQVVPA